jgi:hypothetical protein
MPQSGADCGEFDEGEVVGCVLSDRAAGRGAEVRIKGIVDLPTARPASAIVPPGSVAVGNPAQILAPANVFGIERPPKCLRGPGDAMPFR